MSRDHVSTVLGASPFVRTQEGDVDPELTSRAADELRRVVACCIPLLSDAAPRFTTITMQATTFDDSRVNQAGRDLHVTTGE